MKKYQIGFIGGGVMTQAIVRQLLSKKIFRASEILVSDIDKKRLEEIKARLKVKTTKTNYDLVNQSELIFLAVKPQFFHEITRELSNVELADKLIISIMAGISIAKIKHSLQAKKIVRIMPNTPAQVGYGMSVWTSTNQVSKTEKDLVRKLLSSLGEEIYVRDEKLINSATAISGSGPAYLFLVMGMMYKEAVNLGFDKDQARQLVIQTVLGSAQIAKVSNQDFKALREKVTSKGGTTEAALKILDQGRFDRTISCAIQTAYKRAQELGR